MPRALECLPYREQFCPHQFSNKRPGLGRQPPYIFHSVWDLCRPILLVVFLFLNGLNLNAQCGTCIGSLCTDCDTSGICQNWGSYPLSGCPPNWINTGCSCCSRQTPILIDVDGSGFSLTGLSDGVFFDLAASGQRARVSWVSPNSTNGWLALDRNGNGAIDDGSELFGDITVQPSPKEGVKRNGYAALAEFDKLENGGNNDGYINPKDAVFKRLVIWQDINHDGISQPAELKLLTAFQIYSISLNFTESRRQDNEGNIFRYKSRMFLDENKRAGRATYDVILLKGPLQNDSQD